MKRIETLESRFSPAVTSLAGGVLSVSAQVGPLTVETVVVGTIHHVRVQDDVTDLTFKQSTVTLVNIQDTPGDDLVFLKADTVPAKYDLAFTGSTGTNTVFLEGHYRKNFTYNGGTGTDQLLLATGDTKVNGSLTFNGGLNAVNLIVIANQDVQVDGPVTLNVQTAQLTFFAVSDTAGLHKNYKFKGPLNYFGGAGADQVSFATNFNDNMRFEDVFIDLGTPGPNPDLYDFFQTDPGVIYDSLVVVP